jgi:hypothetical protein
MIKAEPKESQLSSAVPFCSRDKLLHMLLEGVQGERVLQLLGHSL